MKAAAIRIEQWDPHCRSRVIEEFLERAAFDAKAERTARRVLDEIRRDGDAAVAKYARQFDGVDLDPAEFSVPRRELTRAREKVDGRVKEAVRMAHRRITAFATRGLKQDWSMPSPRGGTLGEQFRPLDRVGVYVPGGAAPLVSTALMTATLARVAGVPEVVACTPCGEDKKVNPALLHALEVAGATEIYRVGGAGRMSRPPSGRCTATWRWTWWPDPARSRCWRTRRPIRGILPPICSRRPSTARVLRRPCW